MKNGFEYSWFYFDIVSEDNIDLVIAFYNHPYFLTFDIGLLDIFIYRNGVKEHFGYAKPINETIFQKKPLRIKISDGQLYQSGCSYKIYIGEKDIEIDLDLDPKFPDWRQISIPLFKLDSKYFNWNVYSPYLNVEGFIRLRGEKVKLKGLGYLDGNEGNIIFNEYLSSWMWGRFTAIDQSIIFGSLKFTDETFFQRVLLINKNKTKVFEIKNPIILSSNELEFPEISHNGVLTFDKLECIESLNLLISKIPLNWKFIRKVHEFIFYRLEDQKYGKRLNQIFANVSYNRYKANVTNVRNTVFKGILETINFD